MRATGRELLDGPVESLDELEENFRDIERANRHLGGVRPVCNAVLAGAPQTVLDVGTGIADVPRALLREAQHRKMPLRVTALDSSPEVIELARKRAAGLSSLEFVRCNAAHLPFASDAFDVAMCNLTLHHCDPPLAVALLRELRRVARRAAIVTDLRRSPAAWLGAYVLTRIFTHNRLTRHDGPFSVLRAYTPAEAMDLARAAGWREPRVRRLPFFRMSLSDAG